MKTEIAKREKYTIALDTAKNRIYYTPTGFWQNPEDFPYYLQDWEKALAQVKKGFTGLADLRQFKTPGQKLKAMLENAQKMVNDAGLGKAAELYGEDTLVELSHDNISKRSGLKRLSFKELWKAEAWLDEA